MSLAYDASGVLDLCERVFRNDLELDCERSNERNTVQAKVSIGGTRYTIVCSAMEKAQVLHLWAFLPFDVESEEKAMQMANACKELNSIMVTGKYTYNLEKDVALELAHCYRDGMSDETRPPPHHRHLLRLAEGRRPADHRPLQRKALLRPVQGTHPKLIFLGTQKRPPKCSAGAFLYNLYFIENHYMIACPCIYHTPIFQRKKALTAASSQRSGRGREAPMR